MISRVALLQGFVRLQEAKRIGGIALKRLLLTVHEAESEVLGDGGTDAKTGGRDDAMHLQWLAEHNSPHLPAEAIATLASALKEAMPTTLSGQPAVFTANRRTSKIECWGPKVSRCGVCAKGILRVTKPRSVGCSVLCGWSARPASTKRATGVASVF